MKVFILLVVALISAAIFVLVDAGFCVSTIYRGRAVSSTYQPPWTEYQTHFIYGDKGQITGTFIIPVYHAARYGWRCSLEKGAVDAETDSVSYTKLKKGDEVSVRESRGWITSAVYAYSICNSPDN